MHYDKLHHPALDTATLVTERVAAIRLGLSHQTLRSWRRRGTGPRYRRLGRALRYAIGDLDAYVAASPCGGGPQPSHDHLIHGAREIAEQAADPRTRALARALLVQLGATAPVEAVSR